MLRLIGQLFGRASFSKAVVWSVWLHCAAFLGYCYLAASDILPWTTEKVGGAPQMVIYSPPPPELPAESPTTFTAAFEPISQPLPMPKHPPSTIASAPARTIIAKQEPSTIQTVTRLGEDAETEPQGAREPTATSISKRHPETHFAKSLTNSKLTELRQFARASPEPPSVAKSYAVAPMICMDPTTKAELGGNLKPPYPSEALRLGIEGDVLVRLLISDNGEVEAVEIVKSSGHKILDQPTVAWLSKWRGRPALKDGTAVWSYYKQRVSFRL